MSLHRNVHLYVIVDAAIIINNNNDRTVSSLYVPGNELALCTGYLISSSYQSHSQTEDGDTGHVPIHGRFPAREEQCGLSAQVHSRSEPAVLRERSLAVGRVREES